MNEKVDFPFPPKHYKEVDKGNYLQHPNVAKLFEGNTDIYLFGQKEALHENSVRSLPNYTDECKYKFFSNQGLRPEFVKLIEQLKIAILDYIAAIGESSESLVELNVKVNDIACHILYLLKLAKNTIGAQLELQSIHRQLIADVSAALAQFTQVAREAQATIRDLKM